MIFNHYLYRVQKLREYEFIWKIILIGPEDFLFFYGEWNGGIIAPIGISVSILLITYKRLLY